MEDEAHNELASEGEFGEVIHAGVAAYTQTLTFPLLAPAPK